jgi:Fe-S-cluster containining protein
MPTKYEQLDALYSTIPTVACRKKCGFSNCGPLQASEIETKRVEQKTGFVQILNRDIWRDPLKYEFAERPYYPPKKEFLADMIFWEPNRPSYDCQFLMQPIGTCRVYVLRPMICRLWGVVDHPLMRCRFGCVPDRWVTPEEARQYFAKVIRIQKEET